MKIKLAQIALASAMMASPFCVAQAEEMPNSLAIYGSLTSPDQGDASGVVSFQYERAIEQQLRFGVSYMSIFSPSDTITTVGGSGTYYLAPVGKQGAVAPFVFAGLSVTGSDYIDTTVGYMIGAGLEFTVSERVTMPIKITKQSYSGSGTAGSFGYTTMEVGFKVYY